MIYTKDSLDEGFRFRTYENKKVSTDKRLFPGQIIQHYREDLNNSNLINTNTSASVLNDVEQSLPQSTMGTPGSLQMKNAPSLSTLNTTNEPLSSGAQLNVYLYFIEAMNKGIGKKKIENQVNLAFFA